MYLKLVRQILVAWFIDDATRMNPNLQYAQAIHGRFTGRGTGIIDTIHLVEVARAIEVLAPSLSKGDLGAIKKWFADYTTWMTTHAYGIAERDATNNHGTCWVMQWILPPPRSTSRVSTPITLRVGNSRISARIAARSRRLS